MVVPEEPASRFESRPAPPARIVVLVSGSGTNLQALIDACAEDPAYGAEIVAVGADRDGVCLGLERAEKPGIPTFSLRVKDFASGDLSPSEARDAWDRALRDEVAKHDPDLVVLAGFMKLVGADFLAEFGGRVINTHPALLALVPGHARPARRPRVRREGHWLHGVLRHGRRGQRTGGRPGRRAGRATATTRKPCTSASRRPSGRCSCDIVGRMARDRMDHRPDRKVTLP